MKTNFFLNVKQTKLSKLYIIMISFDYSSYVIHVYFIWESFLMFEFA